MATNEVDLRLDRGEYVGGDTIYGYHHPPHTFTEATVVCTGPYISVSRSKRRLQL